MRNTSLLCVATLLATPAFAQDECSSAAALASGTPTAFDTTTATDSAPAWTCGSGGGADVWFTFTTTQTANVEVSTCNGANFDTIIEVFTGDCNNLAVVACNDTGAGCSFDTSIASLIGVPSGTNLFIRVGGWQGANGPGTVTLTETADPCASIADDAFENNDTCLTASPLAAGSYPGLFASITDADFYEFTLGANDILDFAVTDTANEDLDFNLYDSSCNLLTFFDTDGITYAAAGTAQTVIVEVFLDPAFAGQGCLNYDAVVGIIDCTGTSNDALEPNNDCGTATPTANGTVSGAVITQGDFDFYGFTVASAATVTVDVLFATAEGDIDIYLWDPTVACDSRIEGEAATTALTAGFSGTDNEAISYTNTTGAAQQVVLEIRHWSGFVPNACSRTYDVVVSGSGGSVGPIGTNYCTQEVNATGVIGAMSAFGVTSIGANNITLTASDLPVNQFGIFVVSDTVGFVPLAGGASNGNICVGGVVGRYQGPGQILNTGGTGSFSLAINVNTIPQGGGILPVSAGTMVFFQCWHREIPGVGSNLTDGLEITLTN